jgi:hypothetical protein
MRELDDLRRAAELVRQPPLDAIVSTARRRRRRTILTVVAAGAAVALLAGGAAALTDTLDRSAPPVDRPAPGRTTPEGIVTADASRLVVGATSIGDPDVRLSLWESGCAGCARPDGTADTRSAMALTTDGYEDTAYLASPVPRSRVLAVEGELRGPRIESPTDDTFLVVDTQRPGEWLVGADGSVQRVDRVTARLAPADPRLWFRCFPAHRPAAWGDVTTVNSAHEYPWCALDPESATAYEWPARWAGSVTLPTSGEQAWGTDNAAQPTFAWWEAQGRRHRRFLADGVGEARDVVWSSPTGRPLFFVKRANESTVALFEPRPVPRVVVRDAPVAPSSRQFDVMVGTPDGAVVAVRTHWTAGASTTEPYHETVIWRGERLRRPLRPRPRVRRVGGRGNASAGLAPRADGRRRPDPGHDAAGRRRLLGRRPHVDGDHHLAMRRRRGSPGQRPLVVQQPPP